MAEERKYILLTDSRLPDYDAPPFSSIEQAEAYIEGKKLKPTTEIVEVVPTDRLADNQIERGFIWWDTRFHEHRVGFNQTLDGLLQKPKLSKETEPRKIILANPK